MKRTAALFLSFVLLICMCPGAFATPTFSDSDSINQLYADAVEAAVNNSIIGGYTDGTFKPLNLLSRGAAAKIICNFRLGTDKASSLSSVSTSFTDVPIDNAYSGYIAYCVTENIISGYSDGTFGPFERLSGYAFAKMLLNTIGYTADFARYTGSSWKTTVEEDAQASGISNQIPSLEQAVSREQAAMMWYSAKTWQEASGHSLPGGQSAGTGAISAVSGGTSDTAISSGVSASSGDYREIPYSSLISADGQYNGQKVKVSGLVGSYLSSYIMIFDKGDSNQCCKVYSDSLDDINAYTSYEDSVEVYGTVNGTEQYGDSVIPVIHADVIQPFSAPSRIETGREYGPFTVYHYLSSSNKLFGQYDITSFRINSIGYSILSGQNQQYRMKCEFSGRSTRGGCNIVIQFLDEGGNKIGEVSVVESVTEDETFSVSKNIGVDMGVIERASGIQFVSPSGDLADTPRKEDVSSSTSTSGSSTRSSTSNSNTNNSNGSSTNSSSNSSTSGSSRSQTGTRASNYDDDPFCNTCGGTGDCPNYCSYGEVQCTSCYLGSCKRCGGQGYLLSYNGKKTTCTSCNNGACRRCGGHGYVECSKCHGTGSCPTCHGSGLKPGRSL